MQRNKSCMVSFNDEAESVALNDLQLDLPTQRKFKDSGQMIAPATIARTGVMEYRAKDCGALFADRDPNSIVKINTSAEALFDADSIESYRATPITIGHPAQDVTIENSKELQKGHLESVPFADDDGEHLSATIVLSDAEAVDTVETGTTQLSSGHTCVLVLADENADWDAEKTMIRANHVAIVAKGRAETAEIADEADEEKEDKTEIIDTAETLALKDEVDSLTAKLEATEDKLKVADAALVDAKAEFKDKVDTLVKSRLSFLSSAAKLTDKDLTNLGEKEAKLLILKDALGKDFSDKSEAYIDVRYDVLLEDGLDEEENSIANELAKHALLDGEDEHKAKPAQNITARDKMIARNSKS